jgi:hypothetical protein
VEHFAERFRARVRQAREQSHQDEQELEHETHDRDQRSLQLEAHVERRFREAESAAGDRSAIQYQSQSTTGDNVHQLSWKAPLPARSLLIRIDQAAGQFWWSWAHASNTGDWESADVLQINRRHIDDLVDHLADQDTWERGDEPRVHLPHHNAP